MCLAFKEISLRSVSLPLSLCAGEALHFGATGLGAFESHRSHKPRIYFMNSTIALSLIVAVDELILGYCA